MQFMVKITSNLIRDNPFGLFFRVLVGAALSMIDAATDIYVITKYYQSDALIDQAQALLAMISTNLFIQILCVFALYKKKSLASKLKEIMITLLFLRPAVDAYRLSSNQDDDDVTIGRLEEMIGNKMIELATEAIPACILQSYVFLSNPEEAGTYALLSIGISAMTTGFTSAMISFDKDIDVKGRRAQPIFYGYIPDDNGLRARCFVLMTLMSALLNLSRSVGIAFLAASSNRKVLLASFLGGEFVLYFLTKFARGDFIYWVPVDGGLMIACSFLSRFVTKTVVDYTGMLHMRHPYVGERAVRDPQGLPLGVF